MIKFLQLASGSSLWHGLDYFKEKRVQAFVTTDVGYEGVIRGTDIYHVSINIANPLLDTIETLQGEGVAFLVEGVAFCIAVVTFFRGVMQSARSVMHWGLSVFHLGEWGSVAFIVHEMGQGECSIWCP